MKRKVFQEIEKWNQHLPAKPLVLNGARQVGKTWLMKEFASLSYPDNYVYINFEDETNLRDLFAQDFDISRIETTISIIKSIDINKDTLFLFDEIQQAQRGMMALKYFNEKAPWRRIIAAGSMLGIAIHKGDSFPVGKVNILDVYPLDFEEFLWAMDQDILDQNLRQQNWAVIDGVKQRAIDLLKLYYYIGGMPGAVGEYVSSKDVMEVRKLQKTLLDSYQLDFSKHAPASEVPRIRMVWESLPTQLAKENKKFIFGAVKEGSRAKDFEMALEWLLNAGLIYKVHRVSKGELPLSGFSDLSAFKVYILDVGLLGAMANLSPKTLVEGNDLFDQYRGALTEQYVYQQLLTQNNLRLFYWSAASSRGEVDFVADDGSRVIPIEVKAGENLQSKSLRAFCEKFGITDAYRLSLSDYRHQSWLTNVPLYAISQYSL